MFFSFNTFIFYLYIINVISMITFHSIVRKAHFACFEDSVYYDTTLRAQLCHENTIIMIALSSS